MKLEIQSIAHHSSSTNGAPFDIVEFYNDDIRRIGILFEAEGHCAILEDTKIFEGDFAFDSNSYRGELIEPHLRKAVAEFRDIKETGTTGTEAMMIDLLRALELVVPVLREVVLNGLLGADEWTDRLALAAAESVIAKVKKEAYGKLPSAPDLAKGGVQ
jgi:hypothetical protein